MHALGGHRRPARFDLSGIEFAYEGYGDRIGALNRALQRRQPIRVLYAPETDLLQFLSHSDLAIWEVRSASNDAIVSYAGIVEFRNNNTLLGLLLGGVFMAVGALVVLFDGRPRRA